MLHQMFFLTLTANESPLMNKGIKKPLMKPTGLRNKCRCVARGRAFIIWRNLSVLISLVRRRKLKLDNTFRRRLGRILNVLSTFNLRPVPKELLLYPVARYTTQKMKFSVKDFFRKLRIWSHLLKKSLMENFIFLCGGTGQNHGGFQLQLSNLLYTNNGAFRTLSSVCDGAFYEKESSILDIWQSSEYVLD